MLMKFIRKHLRFINFALVGGINAAVDFAVYTALMFAGRRPGLCQAVGYCAGVLSSFILNRGVTFRRGTTTTLGRQIPSFLAVNAVSLIVSTLLVELLSGQLGFNGIVAKLPVLAVTSLINYFGYKLLVFVVKEDKDD